MEAPGGFVKITSHAKSDKVLGIQIICARASDMISEATLALEFASSTEDIARTIHAHPTMPEAIKEAAHVLLGHAVHV
jgi:dihydrolipoamide dehydrogenase